jgi:hypothetical protein
MTLQEGGQPLSTYETTTEAKRYLDLGWNLGPIEAGSKDPHHKLNKMVMGTTSTNTLRKMAVTAQDLERWFSIDPRCGVAAYVNGPGEPRCIDFDGEAGRPLPSSAELVGLPFWPMMYTPRDHGGFRVFGPPGADDLRGIQHRWGEFPVQAVLPPAIHKSGRPYSWAVDPTEYHLVYGHPTPLTDAHLEVLGALEAARKKRTRACDSAFGHIGTQIGTAIGTETTLGHVPPGLSPQELAADPKLDLRAFDRDEIAVRAMTSVLGLSLDRDFSCPLHPPDRNPSACLLRGDSDGAWFMWCHHSELTYTLADVRASRAGVVVEHHRRDEAGLIGHHRAIPKVTQAIYKLRLLHEAGLIEPFPLPELRLPLELSADEQQAWDAFRLLVSLDWRYDRAREGEPVMFTSTFAVHWAGFPNRKMAAKAIRALEHHGLMRLVARQRHCRLWVPAPYEPEPLSSCR